MLRTICCTIFRTDYGAEAAVSSTIDPTDHIFQTSDLNRQGRTVLNCARAGVARLRDTDGTSIVVMSESRFAAMVTAAHAAANFMLVEERIAHGGGATLAPAELGEWTWLRHLDVEDLAEFLKDVREALIVVVHESEPTQLLTALREWKATAEALADELSRSTLLGSVDADDLVPAARPEVAAVAEAD